MSRDLLLEVEPLRGRRLQLTLTLETGKCLKMVCTAPYGAGAGATIWTAAASQDPVAARSAMAEALAEYGQLAPDEFRGLLLDAVAWLAGRDPEAVLLLAREVARLGLDGQAPPLLMQALCGEARGGDGAAQVVEHDDGD